MAQCLSKKQSVDESPINPSSLAVFVVDKLGNGVQLDVGGALVDGALNKKFL